MAIISVSDFQAIIGRPDGLSSAETTLFNLVQPLAEAALSAWMDQELEIKQHVEYLPVGQAINGYQHSPLENYRRGTGNSAITAGFGNGTDSLALRYTPVIREGLEVREQVGAYAGTIDDAFPASSILVEGTDYFLDVDEPARNNAPSAVPAADDGISRSGILRRIGTWPAEPRCIKVTYYGGLNAANLANNVGGAIKLAALKTVLHNYTAFKASIASNGESLGSITSESIGKYSWSRGSVMGGSFDGASVPPGVKNDMFRFKSLGRYL